MTIHLNTTLVNELCVCSAASNSAASWTVAHQLLYPLNFTVKNTGRTGFVNSMHVVKHAKF